MIKIQYLILSKTSKIIGIKKNLKVFLNKMMMRMKIVKKKVKIVMKLKIMIIIILIIVPIIK